MLAVTMLGAELIFELKARCAVRLGALKASTVLDVQEPCYDKLNAVRKLALSTSAVLSTLVTSVSQERAP